jgi:hypothetical protein
MTLIMLMMVGSCLVFVLGETLRTDWVGYKCSLAVVCKVCVARGTIGGVILWLVFQ